MAQKLLGIDLTVVGTTPTNEPGITVEDTRGKGGVITYVDPIGPTTVNRRYSPGAVFKYVKALGTITVGDAVKLDITAPLLERDWSVIRTAAVDEVIDGIAFMSMTSGQFGWIQIKGKFYDANVATAAVAGAFVQSSATAGRLATATPSATNAMAAATGVAARALTNGAANLADVLLF